MTQYKDEQGNTITVQRGKGWKGLPVNQWTDEQRVEVGLFPMPVPEPYVPTVKDCIQQIAGAAKAHIDSQLDPDGMLLVDRMTRVDPPNVKALACEQWLLAIRTEQYNRMAQLEAGLPWSDDMADFSAFGDKPYTIGQLMMEM